MREQYSGGIGLPGALFITFLVLKLTGVIAWSWIWVFAPLWIPWAFVFGILLMIVVLDLLIARQRRRLRRLQRQRRS